MAPKKNVVLMVADDLGRQLGCYGNKVIKTPHIDWLAAQGTRFEKGFASTASCSCSRSTLYTGLHVHQNGQYGLANRRHHFTTYDHVESSPRLMGNRDYLTAIVGKVHVGPNYVYPWDIKMESDTRDVAWVADQCASVMEQACGEQNKPFFLTVGFIDPHRDLTRGGFGNEGPFDDRVKRVPYDPSDVEVPPFLSDLPGTRTELASYYESISRMDQGVGMILSHLDRLGVADDTLVIFLSDNGPPFVNSKTTLYDAGVNLPLIVRCPSMGKTDVISPNMISWVDILPTILDYTSSSDDDGGANPGPNVERLGRSILPILTETSELPEWSRVYGSHTFHEVTNYWPTRYIRDRRYKYHRNMAWRLDFPFAADIYGSLSWEDIRNAPPVPTNGGSSGEGGQAEPQKMIGNRPLRSFFFRPPEELYDLSADPYEVHNLIDRDTGDVLADTTGATADHKAARLALPTLRTDLEAWQRRSEDAWLYRDGVSVLFVKHHLDAGMRIPDRVDFDVNRVATHNLPDDEVYPNPPLGVPS
jgi:N-sulfoglucosamine sulfohydrolase